VPSTGKHDKGPGAGKHDTDAKWGNKALAPPAKSAGKKLQDTGGLH